MCYQHLPRHTLDSAYIGSLPLSMWRRSTSQAPTIIRKCLGMWRALVPLWEMEENSKSAWWLFKGCFPPHTQWLFKCSLLWHLVSLDKKGGLMPPILSQLVLQQWVSKCIWQRWQTGNTGVCSPSHVCARGKRAGVAAYFPPETSCSWSTSLYLVSEHILQKNKKGQIWFFHACFHYIIGSYLTNLGQDCLKLREFLQILQILHRFINKGTKSILMQTAIV